MRTKKNDTNHLSIVYTHDYNILLLHDTLVEKLLLQNSQKLKELLTKLQAEEEKIQQPQFVNQRRLSLRRIEEFNKEIVFLRKEANVAEFNECTKELREEYLHMGQHIAKVVFSSQNKEWQRQEPKNMERRLQLVSQYFWIAKEYLPVEVLYKDMDQHACPSCKFPLNQVPSLDGGNYIICPSCDLHMFQQRNPSSVVTVCSSDYEDRENFRKAFTRHRGGQPNRLPSDLPQILDKYFISLGLPKGEEIKKMPLRSNGRRGNVGKKLLRKALYDVGYSDFYEDENLICHLYWGWNLPDIAHLEEKVMYHYDLTEKVYKKIQGNRVASINTQYRLFKHLELVGYPCTINDFKMVTSKVILNLYDSIWQQMCDGANDPEIHFIPTTWSSSSR